LQENPSKSHDEGRGGINLRDKPKQNTLKARLGLFDFEGKKEETARLRKGSDAAPGWGGKKEDGKRGQGRGRENLIGKEPTGGGRPGRGTPRDEKPRDKLGGGDNKAAGLNKGIKGGARDVCSKWGDN